MAKILAFIPIELRRHESDCIARQEYSAEVILFPGVRYERWDDSGGTQPREASATKKRSRERQRDVLELAE
jgi:hypothetical protein